MFYVVQTSTLPPRMHQKLTKHGRFCKQNNQLPTKTHAELFIYFNRRFGWELVVLHTDNVHVLKVAGGMLGVHVEV
jgi:hypothetical protein